MPEARPARPRVAQKPTTARNRRERRHNEEAPPSSPVVAALLTSEEAAQYLNVTPRLLRKLWATGRVAGVKLAGGNVLRFRIQDLDALIEKSVIEAVR